MPYDPTSEADIKTAIEMAQRMNAAEPDMRGLIQSAYLPPKPQQPYQFGDLMGEMTAPGRRDISQGAQTQAAVQSQYPQGTVIPQMSEADRAKMREAAWQRLSGFGSTVYNAAAAAIPEALPSFIVGEPWQRKQLAQDIGAMPDAFAGMGSAIVGPSFERAANMTRRGILGSDAADAAKVGVQVARDVVNKPEFDIPLAGADMEPAMLRSQTFPTDPSQPLPEVPAVAADVPAAPIVFPKGMKLPKLDPRDMNVVQSVGKTAEEQKLIADTLKRTRDNYNPREGFGDFQVIGGKFEETGTGEKIFVPKFKEEKYGFDTPPPNMDEQQWQQRMSGKVVKEVSDVVKRANAGDQAAVNILKEARWYRAMRERMRGEFGGLGDVFADLLGTTSAQTGVTQNWNNAIEILRRFSRGEYDREIAAYENLLATGGDTNPVKLQQLFKEGQFPLITKASGQLFNANSPSSTRALLGLFRDVRAGTSPKTPNFTGNLIGYSNDATIDVWAARMLRRLAGMKAIPPAAEKAVGGKHVSKTSLFNPKISGEFGFGQKVLQKAADDINNMGIIKAYDPSLGNLGADDLQAVAWFIEKERWTKKGWTSKAGEGGSLDFEANLAGASDPQRVRELRKIANEEYEAPAKRKTETPEEYSLRSAQSRAAYEERTSAAQSELDELAAPLDRYTLGVSRERPEYIPTNKQQLELAKPLQAVVKSDPAVIAYQTNNSIGRYAGKNERSLNAEFVVRSDFDPRNLARAVVEAGKQYNQDSVFISKVLRSPEGNPNARPGIEIYFKKQMPSSFVRRIADKLVEKGIDGFTYITDARQADRVETQALRPERKTPSSLPRRPTAGLTGIRFQYVPEFDDAFSLATRDQIIAQKQVEYDKILGEMLQQYPEIANGNTVWYDTEWVFNGDYDAYLARTNKAYGGGVRGGQPYRADFARSGSQSAILGGRSGDVYHRVSGAEQEADIQAALNTARQNFEGGGVAIPQSKVDEGIREANLSLQELRGAKQYAQDQAYDNMSWGDYAKAVGQNLYNMKDVGLFHDIIPGAIQSTKQAVTLPGRAMRGEVDVYNNNQMIPEAFNFASTLTGGAGVVPADANSLRIGFSGVKAKTADLAAIERAKKLHQAGADPRQIWEQTGYFPHPNTEGVIRPPSMVRYEQPQDMFVDVQKLQKAPTYDYKYDLPDVFSEKSFEAAYPDIYASTPVYARFRDGKQPARGAAMTEEDYHPTTGAYRPAEVFMGDVSGPAFQSTKGEVGSIAHELNHIIASREGLPMPVPPQNSIQGPLHSINEILQDPATSAADAAYYKGVGRELSALYNQNPGLVNHALYLHSVGEAMSRIAEKMAAYPELRTKYPLDLLDVKPEWLTSLRKQPSGQSVMREDPAIALEIAKFAMSQKGKDALSSIQAGNTLNYSADPVDAITSALMTAKGMKP